VIYFVDDFGRVLTPLLFTYMLFRYVTSTRFWSYWDTRAIAYLLGCVAVVGWASLIISGSTAPVIPPWEWAPYVSAAMWLVVASAGVALVGGYEREQYRARRTVSKHED
jgi:hypothetical protein